MNSVQINFVMNLEKDEVKGKALNLALYLRRKKIREIPSNKTVHRPTSAQDLLNHHFLI